MGNKPTLTFEAKLQSSTVDQSFSKTMDQINQFVIASIKADRLFKHKQKAKEMLDIESI